MIFLGSDHRGFDLKEEIKKYLDKNKIDYIDCGTDSKEIAHYPLIAKKVCTSMNKEKRKKEIMHILDAIYNYGNYEDYYSLKLKIENMCKEKNYSLDDLHYQEYPNEMEW